MEVGGVSPTGKSFRFVRACERARRGEAVCACETMLFPWLGCKTRKSPPAARALACPCLSSMSLT